MARQFKEVVFLTALLLFSDIANAEVKATIKKVEIPKPQYDEESFSDAPEDAYILQVEFAPMSSDEFEVVKKTFGGLSKVPYIAGKKYSLIDFLPPAMQAVADQTFDPHQYNTKPFEDMQLSEDPENEDDFVLFPLRKNGLSSFTNCWGTTLEILRSMHSDYEGNYNLYMLGRDQASELFRDDAHSTAIKASDLKFGDVIAVHKKAQNEGDMFPLQHTAIYLGDGLIFEKVDARHGDPYRISYLSDLSAKYKRLLQGQFSLEYRRVLGTGKPILPTIKFPTDVLTQNVESLFKKHLPEVNTKAVTVGCEEGLGGGCDNSYSVAFTLKLINHKASGRGILSGPQSVLKRFRSLDGKVVSEGPVDCAALLKAG